jgi:hypothetical protein
LDEDINVAIRPMITPDATAEQEDGDRLVGGPIRECAGKLLDLILTLIIGARPPRRGLANRGKNRLMRWL